MNTLKIPGCPSCKNEVVVTEYTCPKCGITVKGRFRAGFFAPLDPAQTTFVAAFLASHGNIKQVETRLGISYPTVKARLREINQRLGLEEPAEMAESSEIIEMLEAGEISVEEALEKLDKEG